MRLWHKDLIDVLPNQQLVAQWRELSAIAGAIQKHGTPNHLLVNFVYYPTSEIWTTILFIIVPIVGIVLMILCFKILNLKERSKNKYL